MEYNPPHSFGYLFATRGTGDSHRDACEPAYILDWAGTVPVKDGRTGGSRGKMLWWMSP